MQKKLSALVGTVLVIGAIILAEVYQFKHFYEILLVGLTMLVGSALTAKEIDRLLYYKLFLLFVPVGFILDYVLGISVTHLWFYNYTNIYEYWLLYLLVYPLGGIVMLQSYLLFRKYIRVAPVSKLLAGVGVVFYLAVTYIIATTTYYSWPNAKLSMVGTLGCFCVLGIAVFNVWSEIRHKKSYARELFTRFVPVMAATLCATYVNAFLHELPNVVARQWVYLPTSGTTLDVMILGIPFLVLVAWVFLTLLPVSLYYVLKK